MTLCTFGTHGALLYAHFLFFLFCSETQRIIIFMHKYMCIHVKQPVWGWGESLFLSHIRINILCTFDNWSCVCVCVRASFSPVRSVENPPTVDNRNIHHSFPVDTSAGRTFPVEKTEEKEIR